MTGSLKLSVRLCKRAVVALRRSYCSVSPRNVLKLQDRGVIESVFPEPHIHELEKMIGQPLTVYCGYDPTAESLHIGNLLTIMALLHCQRAGHHPICVVGGATARMGDPTGRTKDREVMDSDVVEKNTLSITESLHRIFNNHKTYFWENQQRDLPDVKILNNADWYGDMNVIDFLSSHGRNFRVGSLLHRDSVKSRLNSQEGMSLTEFTYQVFQSYDWYHLNKNHNCTIQIGGSDQLGNIITGYEYITKRSKKLFYGLLVPLITTSGGEKLGKTAGNAVWLNPDKSTPFDMYQYFLNIADADVEKLFNLFTFLPQKEIRHSIHQLLKDKPEMRRAQKKLAKEVVKLVHGEAGVEQALAWTDVLFNKSIEKLAQLKDVEVDILFKNNITNLYLSAGTKLVDVCLKLKIFKSEAGVLDLIRSGGVRVNHQQETNPELVILQDYHILPNNISLITVGRKKHYIVKWSY